MEGGGGEGSSEEREMEEFFALIRRFHEARTRRKRELLQEEEEEEEEDKEAIRRKRSNQSNYCNKKAKIFKKAISEEADEERQPSSWAPVFQWEDFNTEKQPSINIKAGDHGAIIDNDSCQKEEGENDDLPGLDLNLAL